MRLRPHLFCLLALASAVLAADQPAADPAIKAVLDKVNATGASLMPVAADGKTYRFTALNVAKEFTDAGLAALAPIAEKITSVDLARTKVTDAGLVGLTGMKNLTELHLENTGITDAGLDHLKGLGSLEYLNLYNTKVTDAGAKKLAEFPKLKALYLWQTGVTKAGVAQIKAKLPTAQINTGWTAEDDAKAVAVAAPPAVAATKPAAPVPAAAKPADAPKAAPAAAGAKLDPAIAAKAVVYKDVIAPILEAKCVSCHGAEKKKGKLQLHEFAAIMKGGSEGDVNVVPGKPDDSLLLARIKLPDDDDEHMPPSDEPQVTKEELALLKWWIAAGASDTATVAAAKPTPDVESALSALLGKNAPKTSAPKVVKEEKPKAKPLTEAEKKQGAEITAKIQSLNASLMPLAQDTEQLRLSVINATDKFGDQELALLAPIATHIVWVDLARSKVTDAAAETLSKMSSLERLHLENTKVTDAGLAKLASLQKLEYLNLYGTKTTDAGIAKLAAAKGLKKLFVWQTGVTQAGAKALEGQLPGLKVNVGLSEAEIAKLTAAPPVPPAASTPPKKEEPKKDAPKPEAKKSEAKPAVAPPVAKPVPAAKADAPPPAKPADAKPPAPAPKAN
ncbi:c-type cytochrome domain-containing protein [Prosthecobacter dejongeii]|uniref:Cytochrome c domain-containing protein n=1 Tax=Prosthecobacter dejongeii TaxID=48465 RepID=A0A7W7YN67_9BACT|nr:c-type cytochrome domain-containing protein [Prosthecobacter dejongeii]MBB5039249.1 hypothetical protein [Prosthecobacter dejongeii]